MKRFKSKTALGLSLMGIGALFPVNTVAQDAEVYSKPADRTTLNLYGTSGVIDMPSAEMLPDGEIAVGVSTFGGTTRTTLTFQATPRIQTSFRYSGIKDATFSTFDTYRDRSFDVRFLLNRESRLLPAVTVGLQDFAGTGIYAGEFITATKNFSGGRVPGTVKATVGLGWGRLGSSGAIGAPFGSDRAVFQSGDTGGEFSVDQWFRGEAAPFAGLEWQINDKWGVKAEYSSDAYDLETRSDIFDRKSRFNFGVEYQVSNAVRLGGYYMYGSELGLNAQFLLNPARPIAPVRIAAPRPYKIRPSRRADPEAYSRDWAASQAEASVEVRDALIPLLEAEGLTLIEARTSASTVEVRYSNERYGAGAIAVGRVARLLAAIMPASVETFRIVPVIDNLAQSTVVLRRSDLEALEVSPNAPDALLAVTGFEAAAPRLPGSARNEALFPTYNWSISPYLSQRYFDPDDPVQIEAGLQLNLSFQPAPGWKIAGQLRHNLADSYSDKARFNTSRLEHVRTDAVEYDAGGATSVTQLYASKQWKAGPDLYARMSAGYLERMFGGVSAEVLWKPVASRLALGAELNYAKQRAFDNMLGFQDYGVATGHVSAYYEFQNGYTGQLDVGRYLAGDVGATVTLEREFDNGWKVGGFFTLTNVSKEDFGEGSFDKGINITVPTSWLLGKPDTRLRRTSIRPLTRDGGARLSVPGRLYEQVRSGHREQLVETWSGVWE
ncbi:hypothetical protein GGR95_001682 [Sulfitobacter undariae]|uniref:Exopolysaccharide biosynthesis protein YbjH n=1 Tax=Sulfitobacter undariae TaxID=1563671 RepID=A0A7W6E3F1_9RHOB|nr:YjbH domain-containing protein [Sulfitobacter undariae]MBB3994041.1 hypothetical protein [Sulfitobacter undariae]